MARTLRPPSHGWRIASAIITALMIAFLLVPILVVLPLSFSSGSFLSYPLPGLSFRWYEELVTSYKWVLALKNSFIVGSGAAILSTALGLSAAIGLKGAGSRWGVVVTALLVAPMVMPVIIIAVSVFFFFSRVGLTQSVIGLILAHTVLGTPYVFISARGALQNFDMTLMRAGLSLGASPWTCYRRIMLPLLRPAIVAGMLFAFIASFDEVVIVLFLAGPGQITLPIRLFEGIREELTPVITSAATVMIVISVGAMLIVEGLRGRKDRTK